MAVNQPTLRVLDAAYTTVAVLIGLALALLPGAMAAKRPGELTWLALDGTALMLVLLSLVGLERLERWLASGRVWWVWMTVIVAMLGVLALIGVTLLRTWRRTPVPSAAAVFLAGLCVAYLLMPLMHHVMGTDGYYYISDSDNFFAGNVALRFAVWLIAAALAVGVTRLRKHLEERRPFAAS
jgi:hypothetical protein